MATRQSGEMTMRFNVNGTIRASRKHPVKLTSNVPQGNVLPARICTSPCSPYRASVPTAPKTAINARRKVAPIRPGNSIVETIAQLHKDFARIQVVGAAKGKAVVEQDAAVRAVYGPQVGGELVAENFAERNGETGT